MTSRVKVHYPDPSNFEAAFLIIGAVDLPCTYQQAKEMTAVLASMGSTDTIDLPHSKGVLTADATLAAEIYAALVEIIVDVEIGEDLAMFEVEELAYACN